MRTLSLRARITVMFVLTVLGVGLALIGIVYAYLRFTPVPFQAVLGANGIDGAPGTAVIDAAVPITREILRVVLLSSLGGLAVLTALSGLIGWWVAGLVIRPLRTIADAAGDITRGDLTRRIEHTGADDEAAELASALNTMLDTLAASIAAQRRFAANASHELNTPITTIQTVADVALADPDASAADLRAGLTRIREVNSRNARTTASLLSLAELEGGAKIAAEQVDLSALCSAVAQERGIPADIAENVTVTGDRDLVRHAVDNLARNAVQHGAAGTAALRLRAAGDGGAALTVTNGGEVLDPAEVATLTEPFARARQRGHSKGGHGLGVALVQAIAAAHGGSLALEARPQGGVTATLHL
ncbi:Sensor kinase CusS [Corynebacterium glaucum]|uniref:histidine kinase n=1 Tax=Corynebacterium glaucum TaxID=187491 RepID=A0A1Q2HVM1_9CORY|nr:HAMP domain-containing sensor histidine kinase [Corynebacterium glaucum]AQQ14899.1 Sensor kinase CusS [Corynebacterium glaucum]